MDLYASNESPPLRSTVLGFGAAFLRGRPRATSHVDNSASAPSPNPNNNLPPPELNSESSIVRSPSATGHRRRPGTGGNNNSSNSAAANQLAVSQDRNLPPTPSDAPASAPTPTLGLSMLRRRRSGNSGAVAANANATASSNPVPSAVPSPLSRAPTNFVLSNGLSTVSHRIRLVPHLDSRRTLRFDPICRNLKEGDAALRIGRFTDRSGLGLAAANALGSNKLAFKSKVVSRAHAEIWVEAGGKFLIKDTKSSSGTFLNHVRLSPANTESKPYPIKDGDIVQLGVDYQGGTEDMYKSVKIRIEVGREWQAAANAFNTNALSQLKSLAVSPTKDTITPPERKKPSAKTNIPDCCICLFAVTIRQALFIAPCSHAFHYKCIRPLLETHHAAFSCPLCRTFADLEEDVEVEVEAEVEEEADAEADDLAGDAASCEGYPGPAGVSLLPSISARTRDRSRDREGGAETEVEADRNGGFAARVAMQRSQTRVHQVADPTEPRQREGVDTEMMDAIHDPQRVSFEDSDVVVVDAFRSTSLSPDFAHNGADQAIGVSRAGASGIVVGDTSDGEGSGGSAEGVPMDAELGDEGGNGELAVGAKRKR